MDTKLSRPDRVERELDELRQSLRESLGILESLKDIYQQVDDVAATYSEAKDLLNKAQSQLSQLESKASDVLETLDEKVSEFETRFGALEAENADKWASHQAKLTTMLKMFREGNTRARAELEDKMTAQDERVRAELGNRIAEQDKSVRAEFGGKILELNNGVEHQVAEFGRRFDTLKTHVAGDVKNVQKTSEARIREVDERANSAISRFVDRINYVEESLKRTKQRANLTRALTLTALVVAVLAAGYLAYPFVLPLVGP